MRFPITKEVHILMVDLGRNLITAKTAYSSVISRKNNYATKVLCTRLMICILCYSNNQPVMDEKTTVRVSPFSGASHICPDDGTPTERKLMLQKFSGETLEVSFANLKRLMEAAVPPQNLEGLYQAGYDQTDEFIRSGKIRDFLYVT